MKEAKFSEEKAKFPDDYGHRIFKKPISVDIENITHGSMVKVIDSKGWSHTFYAYAEPYIIEREDISRREVIIKKKTKR